MTGHDHRQLVTAGAYLFAAGVLIGEVIGRDQRPTVTLVGVGTADDPPAVRDSAGADELPAASVDT